MEMTRATRTCCSLVFVFLLSLIYSALHRYMKLARYAGQLEGESSIYAPREEKTWTVHISCKLANTRCGLANFTPVERILFFTISGLKLSHSHC